jgi:xanthine dehydrogenase YagS FAD-binding subunit
MISFSYFRAADLRGAVRELVADDATRVIAGGTNLLDLMKENVARPRRLVDITHLPLGEIQPGADGGLRLGALVTNTDVAYHAAIEQRYPLLSQAILAGASPQLRNMATVGGNLMQRTRCYYFRDSVMPCNKRAPGSGCSAIEGHNRIHAVLGTSAQCIAASPGDMPVAMAALGAVVRVRGPNGERAIALQDFHVLPGAHPEHETTLQHGELIIAVDIPALSWARRSHYRKVRDRASYAFALASAAVALDLDGGHIRGARVAMGGVGTKPWRSTEAERTLVGQTVSPALFRAAGDAAMRGAVPHRENGFKIELGARTVARALTTVAAMA